MREPELMRVQTPEVTLEEVFQVEGADYSKRPPRPSTIELYRLIIAEALTLVKPVVIWREVEIKGVEGQEIQLEDGFSLTSPLLTKLARNAEKLALSAMTIGSALEDRLATYNN